MGGAPWRLVEIADTCHLAATTNLVLQIFCAVGSVPSTAHIRALLVTAQPVLPLPLLMPTPLPPHFCLQLRDILHNDSHGRQVSVLGGGRRVATAAISTALFQLAHEFSRNTRIKDSLWYYVKVGEQWGRCCEWMDSVPALNLEAGVQAPRSTATRPKPL